MSAERFLKRIFCYDQIASTSFQSITHLDIREHGLVFAEAFPRGRIYSAGLALHYTASHVINRVVH